MLLEPAQRFVRALQKTGRRRIPLDMLRQLFAAACPEFAEQPDRRTRLGAILRTAAKSGAILLPRSWHNWDKTGGAALPLFITLAPAQPAPPSGYAWHPLLTFASGERNRLRLESAQRINEWLKADPDLDLVVPIKERSLEIFGDEKRLDRLRASGTTLFGQLSLAVLGCRVCPIPLPFEAGPERAIGEPILIVENNDTWVSFAAWNRNAARYSAIVYVGGGYGKNLTDGEAFIDELLQRFQARALFYFGDLDPVRLRIPSRAAERRARSDGLPLQPAASLYAWLLANGIRTRLRQVAPASPSDLAWLPKELRIAVHDLFAARQRIPQEALGTRVLAANVVDPAPGKSSG